MSEDRCGRCGGPNVVWSAPSPLWNAVMRGGSINGEETHGGIVCPTCFAVLAEEQGIACSWRLDAQLVHSDLETVTPSGRVWNATEWRWESEREREAVPRRRSAEAERDELRGAIASHREAWKGAALHWSSNIALWAVAGLKPPGEGGWTCSYDGSAMDAGDEACLLCGRPRPSTVGKEQ